MVKNGSVKDTVLPTKSQSRILQSLLKYRHPGFKEPTTSAEFNITGQSEKPPLFQCVTCLWQTRSAKLLVKHFWKHQESTAIICSGCNLVTHQNLWNIYMDLIGNTGCPNCSENFDIKMTGCHCQNCIRLLMLRGNHRNISLTSFQPCPKCSETFTRSIKLLEHLEAYHNYTTYWGQDINKNKK